jgi:hypothetical protein
MKKILFALGIVLTMLPACDTEEACVDPEDYCACFPENCSVTGDALADETVAPESPAKATHKGRPAASGPTRVAVEMAARPRSR